MKRIDLLKEVRSITETELRLRLARLEKELAQFSLKKAMRQLKNPMKIRVIRKEIAIIKTIQMENALGDVNA